MNRTISIQTRCFQYRDDLFFLAYMFLFLNAMLSTYINFGESDGDGARSVARVCYLLFLGICVLSFFWRESYSTMEILSIAGLLCLGITSYLLAGSHIFFDLTLIIAISKNVDFNKFIKRAVLLLVIFLFVVICLSGLEVISAVVMPRPDNAQMRNSLGFGHPNTLGLLIFQLIAGVIVLERNHLKTVHLWLLLGLGLLFYWITRSQSCLIGVCLLVFAVLIYKWVSRKVWTPLQIKRVLAIVLIAAAVILFFVIRYYWQDPSAMPFSTLAARFRFAQRYLDAYGVNLFGQDIVTGDDVVLPGYGAGYAYLDNGEMWYLLRFGIIGCAIFFYTYIRMIVKSINKKEFVLCIIAVVYLIYSLTENSALRMPCNFMIIYAGMMLYSGNIFRRERAERMCRGEMRHTRSAKDLSGATHEQLDPKI